MGDLVERLRAFVIDFTVSAHHPQICTDAADEIERLTAALSQAYEECAKICEGDFDSEMKAYGKHFAAAIRARGQE